MKKTLLLAAVSLVALSAAAPAVAADLAARPYTKAPPAMVAAIYDWSGFYIGINGGGASSHTTWDFIGVGREGSHDATGGTVGGQIGYRWQSGQWCSASTRRATGPTSPATTSARWLRTVTT